MGKKPNAFGAVRRSRLTAEAIENINRATVSVVDGNVTLFVRKVSHNHHPARNLSNNFGFVRHETHLAARHISLCFQLDRGRETRRDVSGD